MDHNQMALHSYAGCVQPANVSQLGRTVIPNCNDTTASGCTVAETKPGSFGAGFAQANGGAFGLQFDVAGVFMWFWPVRLRPFVTSHPPSSRPRPFPLSFLFYFISLKRRDYSRIPQRPNIPASITQATPTSNMNISDWGMPSAAYPATGCNITEFFPAQELVIGAWRFSRRWLMLMRLRTTNTIRSCIAI
jgi:hypothetical protein